MVDKNFFDNAFQYGSMALNLYNQYNNATNPTNSNESKLRSLIAHCTYPDQYLPSYSEQSSLL